MFNKKSIKPVTNTNARFAEIIRGVCLRNLMKFEDFAAGIDQPLTVSQGMFYGTHEWMGFVTFKELDVLFKSTPGHWEQVYKNVINNN